MGTVGDLSIARVGSEGMQRRLQAIEQPGGAGRDLRRRGRAGERGRVVGVHIGEIRLRCARILGERVGDIDPL